jgi:hypothetical protein
MVTLVQCGKAKNNAYKQLFFCSIYQGKLQRFPQSSETSFFFASNWPFETKKNAKN